jgi:hypothetical protein
MSRQTFFLPSSDCHGGAVSIWGPFAGGRADAAAGASSDKTNSARAVNGIRLALAILVAGVCVLAYANAM